MATKNISITEHEKICLQREKELNASGCEFGRKDANRLTMLESDYKSELGSVRAGQKLFIEDIFPKMKADVAESKNYVRDVKNYANDIRKDSNWLKWSIILAIITNLLVGTMKLFQDSVNQRQLMEFLLKNMNEKVEK